MDQKRIADLLREAIIDTSGIERAGKNSSAAAELGRHLTGLRRKLGEALDGQQDCGAVRAALEIYDQVLKSRPSSLLMLFPMFAALAGDRREGDSLAAIDWSAYDETPPPSTMKAPPGLHRSGRRFHIVQQLIDIEAEVFL